MKKYLDLTKTVSQLKKYTIINTWYVLFDKRGQAMSHLVEMNCD